MHEASKKHQQQQLQRHQRQQGTATLMQGLHWGGDLAARKRLERMQHPGLRMLFGSSFHHLQRGRPITNVSGFEQLLQTIGARNVPDMHWKSNSGGAVYCST